jgi:hypothetical protein
MDVPTLVFISLLKITFLKVLYCKVHFMMQNTFGWPKILSFLVDVLLQMYQNLKMECFFVLEAQLLNGKFL